LLLGQFFSRPDVGFAGGNVEEHETGVVYVGAGRQSLGDGANGDCGGFVNGIAKGSGRYRWEGQRFYSVIVGGANAFKIATG